MPEQVQVARRVGDCGAGDNQQVAPLVNRRAAQGNVATLHRHVRSRHSRRAHGPGHNQVAGELPRRVGDNPARGSHQPAPGVDGRAAQRDAVSRVQVGRREARLRFCPRRPAQNQDQPRHDKSVSVHAALNLPHSTHAAPSYRSKTSAPPLTAIRQVSASVGSPQ